MLQKPPTKDRDGIRKNARELFFETPSRLMFLLELILDVQGSAINVGPTQQVKIILGYHLPKCSIRTLQGSLCLLICTDFFRTQYFRIKSV